MHTTDVTSHESIDVDVTPLDMTGLSKEEAEQQANT
jgi:hypothetical protein